MPARLDFLSLELTNHCNFDCSFCANHLMSRPKGFMDTALARRLIREARDSRFCDHVVTNVMGEPLLHKGLFEILAYAGEVGQKMVVITNGGLLSEDVAFRFLEHSPASIGISYHANNERAFCSRKAGLAFDDYEKKVRDFVEFKYRKGLKADIYINVLSTVKTPHESFQILDSVEEIAEFSRTWRGFARALQKKYRIRWLVPHALFPGSNALLPGLSVFLLDSYHPWSNTIWPAGTTVRHARECFCRTPFQQCDVLWIGDLTLCCIDYNGELAFDNVNGKGLVETYRSLKAKKVRDAFVS